jgi:hypothetical protein
VTLTTGQQSLISQINSYASKPALGLPNGPVPAFSSSVTVRWVVQVAGGSQISAGLDARTDAHPEIVVRVETPADSYAGANDTSVADLCALFPVGSTVGTVQIDKAPQPKAPMPYDGVYSVPVIITGRVFF